MTELEKILNEHLTELANSYEKRLTALESDMATLQKSQTELLNSVSLLQETLQTLNQSVMGLMQQLKK